MAERSRVKSAEWGNDNNIGENEGEEGREGGRRREGFTFSFCNSVVSFLHTDPKLAFSGLVL